jgi:hypothetical protein
MLGVDVAADAERLVTALATVTQVEGFGVLQLEDLRAPPLVPWVAVKNPRFGIAHSTLEVEEGEPGTGLNRHWVDGLG